MEDNKTSKGRNDKGQFTENNPGKPKGARNKTSQFTLRQRQLLQKVLDNHMKDFDKLLLTVPVTERYNLIAKFAKYSGLSTVSEVQLAGEGGGDINIVIKHQKPDAEQSIDETEED